jgi:hypothetical protein
MPIQKTIETPANYRVSVDAPREMPVGPIIHPFAPAPAEKTAEANKWDAAARALGYKDQRDYLRANTPATIEEAEAQAQAKLDDPDHVNFFKRYYGALEGEEAYGDGAEYQRKMRSEWPD